MELGLLYFAALEAVGANAHAPMRSLYDSAHGTQIHVPAALGHVVGVTDIVSKLRTFAAQFTYACHLTSLQIGGLDRFILSGRKSQDFFRKPAPRGRNDAREGSGRRRPEH